jgi:hypothetical protein
MEANEAMRRIFWRHRWLLIAFVLIPVAAIAPLRMRQPVTYAATASIQAQAAAPDAETQVVAILSRVTTVATSPAVVQKAINAAGADRSAIDVARHEIAVTSVSSSAIVTMTITDPSRQVAASLVRSLAINVVNVLNGLGTQSSQQLAALGAQRTALNATRGHLLQQMARAQANHELASSAGVQSLIAQLTAVDAQLATNSASVQQVLTSSSINEGAGVISAPAYVTGVSRHVAVYSVLAGLLGLVVGMLIATIHELARPTIAEAGAGAKELSLVYLGDALVRHKEIADLDDELTIRLDLAADRLGARTLVLTGPVPPARLSALATHVGRSLPAMDIPAGGDIAALADARVLGIRALPPPTQSPTADTKSPTGSFSSISAHTVSIGSARSRRLSVVALPAIRLQDRPDEPVLVLVLPRFAPRAALDQAVDLGVITGWPLLGVIGLRKLRKRRHRAAEPELKPEPEPEPSVAEPEPELSVAEPELSVAELEPELSVAEPAPSAPGPEPPPAADDEAATRKKDQHAGAVR